jgi:hypothetical protein
MQAAENQLFTKPGRGHSDELNSKGANTPKQAIPDQSDCLEL